MKKIFTILVAFMLCGLTMKAQNGTWSTNAPMLTPRSCLGVVNFNDKIYAIGGVTTGSELDNVVEEYILAPI